MQAADADEFVFAHSLFLCAYFELAEIDTLWQRGHDKAPAVMDDFASAAVVRLQRRPRVELSAVLYCGKHCKVGDCNPVNSDAERLKMRLHWHFNFAEDAAAFE